MSPSWNNNLRFFLDPQLKLFDREFYRVIVQDLESYGINWSEGIDEVMQDEHLPNVFLLLSDTNVEPTIREMDHVLLFGTSNMSLFGKKEFNGVVANINEVQEWTDFIESISTKFKQSYENAFNSLMLKSDALLKTISKEVNKTKSILNTTKMDALELELLGQPSFQQCVESVERVAKEVLGIEVSILPAPKAYSRFDKSLFVGGLDSNALFLCWNHDGLEVETLWLYSIIEDIIETPSSSSKKETSLDDMQLILSDMPVALALFNKNDELLLHNPLFFQLNLGSKQCLSLENSEQFTQNGELYRTQIVELEKQKSKLFYFIPIKEFLGESSSPSSEELGIITSSIAHELNNPLGGISGALDVILLDEHSEDIEQRLREMKAGVARCKKLVETFLGFSKIKAENVSQDGSHSVSDCMDSAMDLIRFRLIENNIKLEANFSRESSIDFDYNPHVLSMTMYLMLGDLLTNFGHQKLVSNDRSATFDVEFIERKKSIEIKTREGLQLGEDFLSSKLLNHLLEIQGLAVDARLSSITLKSL
ncbi:MAG: hypothetical protein CME64_10470 [Halobacteriovoraceae bacterium]|nr:hypothetical protein [Halobacteriovoraceae bacterium]|tara:strand:+ start:24605 stop:26215 length:1611 start_codon:yes stop_codon:yes gene_type:complete